ncbi:peptidoglycan/LPS O-acetylase OafA/YrhL [Novosphingobium hassiacum]|uniref:Peptidoglycan/LPS O-acetylase OafA/YrhL n=1 Tax=Novosphingobium hassiacum TaxID=173676 RepID=A0A7W6A3G4_9SPHN|nr:peptidoglycan/LPS O-acetylase OafA/YrhL [Novosphingobium hassiacum]
MNRDDTIGRSYPVWQNILATGLTSLRSLNWSGHSAGASVAYRPDIDGLRAVAVFAVVLYHVGIGLFPGGFVGVDIFFVISGYLITSIILREIDAGRFSLWHFYQRRMRRIFPALFAMMAITIVVGSAILLPLDYRALGASTIATALFFSNFYFAGKSGYFGSDAHEAPLLHTWSLAVEEQFYIAFPLLMLMAARWGGRQRVMIVTGAAVSFLFAMWQVETKPAQAFYLPFSRAWEFLGGALLATGWLPAIASRALSQIASATGAALIGWAVLAFSSDTPFPGASAAIPVCGAMLLIHAGQSGSLMSRLLAQPTMAFAGRISYSLYLWHWPIIVFWRYRTDGQWQLAEQALIVVLSITLATLSWAFIEEPFRRKRLARGTATFGIAAVTIAVACASGAVLYLSSGLPQRVKPSVLALDFATLSMARLPGRCTGINPVFAGSLCLIGAQDGGQPDFLLWGDSHARALTPAFDEAGKALGRSGRIASYAACPTLTGIDRLDQAPNHDCSAFNEAVFDALEKTPSVRTVVLVSRWGLCANSTRTEGGKPCQLGLDGHDTPLSASEAELFRSGLETTVARLVAMKKQVILVGPIPEFRSNVPETLARALFYHHPPALDLSRAQYLKRQSVVFAEFHSLQSRFPVEVVYPHLVLCRTGECATTNKGRSLYADDDHLSLSGSMMLRDFAVEALGHKRITSRGGGKNLIHRDVYGRPVD